jgi:hypothetical protein
MVGVKGLAAHPEAWPRRRGSREPKIGPVLAGLMMFAIALITVGKEIG